MNTVMTEYPPISDLGDDFCYTLAQAIRRLLGLSQDGPDETEEEAEDAETNPTQR